MRWTAWFLLALVACDRPNQDTPPLLGITSPQGGVIAQGKNVDIEGYALDDSGVQDVRVGQQKVMAAADAGKKLVRFRFRLQSPQSGQFNLKLTATDVQGAVRVLEVPLVLDARVPTIQIDRVEPILETRTRTLPLKEGETEPQIETFVVERGLRIAGVVQDDTGIDRVSVEFNGRFTPLSLPKGQEVPFFIEIPTKRATLFVVDAAGNRSSRRIP